MAYYNSNNSNFYSAPSASGEFDGYSFLNQMSAIEEANSLATYDPFADPWTTFMQPEPVVDSTASFQASASYGKRHPTSSSTGALCLSLEPVASIASYETLTGGYGQLPYPGYHWPADDQWYQDYHSDFSSRDGPFVRTAASETSTVTPAPSNCKYFSVF